MTILKSVYRSKVLLILVGMFLAASIFVPYFFSSLNIVNIITNASIFGVMAFGMTFVILARELDLSVGATMAFAGVLLVKLIPYTGVAIGILIVLVIGALIGLLSGLLVSLLRLNSFVVTLSVMFFFNGLTLAVAGGQPVMEQDPFLNWLGNGETLSVPNQIWIAIILFIITDYTLRKTKFGRNVYAIGGDEQVAALTGIPVKFYKTGVFVISGFSAAIGGILLTGMQNSASPVAGGAAALSIVSSIVIGGTSLAGGEGSATRTVIGLFIFAILDNSLALLNVSPFNQSLIKGVLLVLVIGWDYYSRRVRAATSLH